MNTDMTFISSTRSCSNGRKRTLKGLHRVGSLDLFKKLHCEDASKNLDKFYDQRQWKAQSALRYVPKKDMHFGLCDERFQYPPTQLTKFVERPKFLFSYNPQKKVFEVKIDHGQASWTVTVPNMKDFKEIHSDIEFTSNIENEVVKLANKHFNLEDTDVLLKLLFHPNLFATYFEKQPEFNKMLTNENDFGLFGGSLCFGQGTYFSCKDYQYSPFQLMEVNIPNKLRYSALLDIGFDSSHIQLYRFLGVVMSNQYKDLPQCQQPLDQFY